MADVTSKKAQTRERVHIQIFPRAPDLPVSLHLPEQSPERVIAFINVGFIPRSTAEERFVVTSSATVPIYNFVCGN